jgi:hypothetical protein
MEEPKLEPAVIEAIQMDFQEPLVSQPFSNGDQAVATAKLSGTRVKLASLMLMVYGLGGTGVSIASLVLLFTGQLYTNPILGPIFLSIIGNARYIGPPILALSLISLVTGVSLLFPKLRLGGFGKLASQKGAQN